MTTALVIVAPMIAACIIAFFLGACWQARRDEEETEEFIERIEAERIIRYGEQHPWELS